MTKQEALKNAIADIQWMSAASDFCPGGQARAGWLKVRDRLDEYYEALAVAPPVRAAVEQLREALKPFANYALKRDAQPLKGLDNLIHRIHVGTEWEAEISLYDCRKAVTALNRTTKEQS